MVRRVVSQRQVALLLDLLEQDRDLAVGRLAGMPLGHADVVNRWAGIAESLNSLGEGATKTGPDWKTYWHELKYKARKRAIELRQHASGTGGGRGKKPLTELELRIINIIGEVAVYGNEEVRLPFDDPLQLAAASAAVPAPALVTNAPALVTNAPAPATAPVTPSAPVPPSSPLNPPLSDESDASASLAPVAGPSGGAPTAARGRERRADTRRRYIRRISAGPPQWAQEFEERRLQVDARAADALQGISEAVGGIGQTLAELLDLARRVEERLQTE